MIKTINSIPAANVKTFLGVPMANVKTIDGLAVPTAGGGFSPADIAGLRSWYKPDSGIYSMQGSFFDRANTEYLSISGNTSLRLAPGPWTICGWFYSYDVAITTLLMAKRDNVNVDYQIYIAGGSLTFTTYNGTGYPGASVPGLANSTWYFFVASYDGAGTSNLQVNNAAPGVSMAVGTPVDTPTAPLAFGTDISNPTAFATTATLQSWCLFGRALSVAERTFLFNGGLGRGFHELDASFKTGLRAWWPLNEPSGSRYDLSGNGNTLTDNNTVTAGGDGRVQEVAANGSLVYRWQDQGPAALHLTQSDSAQRPLYQTNVKNGQSGVVFNPAASLIIPAVPTAALPVAVNAGDAFWVLDSSGTGTQYFLSWSLDGANQYLMANLSGTWYYDHGDFSFSRITAAGATTPWALVEFYRDSGGLRAVLRNGTVLNSLGGATGFLGSGSPLYRMGASTISPTGPISEVAIYNVPLVTADRVALQNHFNSKYALGF